MKKKQSIFIGLILILILVTVLVYMLVYNKYQSKEEDTFEELTEEYSTEEEVESEEETTEEQSTEEEEQIEYPEPEYSFYEENMKIELEGIDRCYKIAWVSDIHMINDLEPADDVMEDQVETLVDRYNNFFVTPDGVHSNELWPEIVKYLNYNDFDAIIFGGDLMDYCSKKNMDYFMEYYKELNPKVPVLYIRADHDYGFGHGGDAFTEIDAWNMHIDEVPDEDSIDNKILDFDSFMIMGVNKSTKNMESWYYDFLEQRYQQAVEDGKQVVIVTHVPYESKVDSSLEDLSYQIRNKIYYWGGGDYVPDETTSKFFDLIYDEDTSVKQVLAGHLHAPWDGMISEQVPQHIFSPAYMGSIGVINIVPASN